MALFSFMLCVHARIFLENILAILLALDFLLMSYLMAGGHA
jgi:hypothetical protein